MGRAGYWLIYWIFQLPAGIWLACLTVGAARAGWHPGAGCWQWQVCAAWLLSFSAADCCQHCNLWGWRRPFGVSLPMWKNVANGAVAVAESEVWVMLFSGALVEL